MISAYSPPRVVSPVRLSARIQSVVQHALDDQRLVGAVVLVAREGELIHQQAAGLADREAGRRMKLDTVFRLASVSKPIVSTAAMVLAAQGRLNLDEPIDRWLPEFRPRLADGRPAQITARQLLSHTAGLGYRFDEAAPGGLYAQAGVSDGLDASGISLSENVRRLASVPLLYEPGTSCRYSLSIDVLGAIIERAHGSPLGMAVRDLVTIPLEMTDTDFVVHHPQRGTTVYVNDRSKPRVLAEGETVPIAEGNVGVTFSPARILDSRAFPSGGGGMAGTASDVLRLLETLRQGGGALLSHDWIDEMSRDYAGGAELSDKPGYGFGLGFSVLRDRMLAASPESLGTWRGGGVYGHSWFVDRARDVSVVALTNTLYEGMSGYFVTALRDAVYDALA